MTTGEIASDCLARWKAIYDSRTIDFRVRFSSAGAHLQRLRRGSPEWYAEYDGAEWLDHLLQIGRGFSTFRELARNDLLLLLIPAVGPVRAAPLVDEFVPPAAHISA